MMIKEYRVCMPLSVEEYHIGQLYMISKHSLEESEKGEGIHVVKNEPCEDKVHGKGQYTEKRVYLSGRLPAWTRSCIPRIFYIEERAWNYYPYTYTEYICSFLPKFSIKIETKYENNNGSTENCFDIDDELLEAREVQFLDIAYDEMPDRKYVLEEDCRYFKSKRTGRGPLEPGWRDSTQPIMCSYKLVNVSFDVWGLSQRVEAYTHRVIRDVLILGHKQAFAWIDQWFDMTIEDVRQFEKEMQEKTNEKVGVEDVQTPESTAV